MNFLDVKGYRFPFTAFNTFVVDPGTSIIHAGIKTGTASISVEEGSSDQIPCNLTEDIESGEYVFLDSVTLAIFSRTIVSSIHVVAVSYTHLTLPTILRV